MSSPSAASGGGPTARAALTLALVVGVASSMTIALTGALIVPIRREFGLGLDTYGALVLAYFLTGSVASMPGGRLIEWLGDRRGPLLTLGLTAGALLTAGLAPSAPVLVLALLVAGVANALAHPAANKLLRSAIPPRRMGTAFGLKQASIPAALAVSGLAVPSVVLTMGWRAAFLGTALVVLAATGLLLVNPGRDRTVMAGPAPREMTRAARGRLIWLGLGAGCASAAASPLGSYLVDWGVATGLDLSTAGLVLSAAGAGGIVGRVLLGVLVDRHRGPSAFQVITVQLVAGAGAYVLIALGAPPVFAAGAVLAYVTTWGWPGLFHFGVVTLSPDIPAAATGLSQIGVTMGAGLGPFLFGQLVTRWSYSAAWLTFAGLSLVGAVTVALGLRRFHDS